MCFIVSFQTQKDQPCCIQSVFRRDLAIEPGDDGGNLLKAGSDTTLEKIDVDFPVLSPAIPQQVFKHAIVPRIDQRVLSFLALADRPWRIVRA